MRKIKGPTGRKGRDVALGPLVVGTKSFDYDSVPRSSVQAWFDPLNLLNLADGGSIRTELREYQKYQT